MFNFNYFRRAFSASKYSKFVIVALCLGIIGATAVVAGSQSASATDICVSLQHGGITINAGSNTATAQVSNPNTNSSCGQTVGLASYKAFTAWNGNNAQAYIDGQTLYEQNIVNVLPGASVTLSVPLPSCNYQVDFFLGNYAPQPPDFAAHSDLQLYPAPDGWKQTFNLGYCTVPPPPVVPPPPQQPIAPACSPLTQTVSENQAASLSASAGNGTFSWNSDGTPSTGNGPTFQPSFSTPGTHTVTVNSDGLSAQCNVTVKAPVVIPQLTCTPSNQNANVGDDVTFNAGGGTGTFSWSAPSGSPSTGNGAGFDTTFAHSGAKHVTVTSGSQTATCNVNVKEIVQVTAPSCSPSNQTIQIGSSASLSATGGDNVNYSWSAPNGSPSTGNGTNFNPSFNTPGTQFVTVTSNGLSDQCTVNVQQQTFSNLSCTANQSNVTPGSFVTFTANGGNGTYNWNAGNANPSFGSGQNFNAQFFGQGFQTVTVNSNGQTATCGVNIQQTFVPQAPFCSASVQNPSIGQQVNFFGSGGTGNFSWTAQNGNPTFGYGSNFVTSFNVPGTQYVTLNSNGQTSQCVVNVQQQQIVQSSLVCTPSTQNANVNDFVTFSAIGGNGSYFWSTTGDALPSSGSSSSFGTRFTGTGTKIVTVSSNGQTSQCVVQIGEVLGASTVDTGADDSNTVAAGIGFIGALGAYGAIFRKTSKKLLLKVVGLVK